MFRKTVLFIILSLALGLSGISQAQKCFPVVQNEVDELIRNLRLGEPIYYRNLTIIPIYSEKVAPPSNYLTLDEAIRRGYLAITEINGGTVPQLRVDNNAGHTVFLMSGEILSGGKQDRVIGQDLLLGPRRKGVTLPVYCTERGRWTFTSEEFESEGIAVAPALRHKISEKKDQAEIWSGIREESQRLGATSKTEAFKDVYKAANVEREMGSYSKKFESVPQLHKNTIGVAVGIHGRVVAIDIFSDPNMFARLWPKLLKSYALNAFGPERPKLWQDAGGETKELLNKIYRAKADRWNALDLGETVKIYADGITATALVYKGGVIHLSVLPPDTIPVLE